VKHLSAEVGGYDCGGEGETWPDTFRAYAADCEKSADEHEALVEQLRDEAHMFKKIAERWEALETNPEAWDDEETKR
jgi:hypothetical protein